MPTWKKILVEGDDIPASDVTAGALGTGSYDIDGALAVDTINEHTSGQGVAVDGLLIKDGALVGFPLLLNLLVNGGFEIWQRGTSFSGAADGTYTADRWQVGKGGTSTINVDRESTTKKANSQYSLKVAYTHNAASSIKQDLKIADGYHHLLGQKVSLRIPVYANTASAVRVGITTDGTGGTTTYSSYHAGNSAWADLSVNGVTIPSDATYVRVSVHLEASCTAYADNAMLVPCTFAQDYWSLTPAEEWERCQRYYEPHAGGTSTLPFVNSYAAAVGENKMSHVLFHTRKAIVPTMTKNGTWAVLNCAQPTVQRGDVHGYVLVALSTAAGQLDATPNSSDDTITAESNP